MTKLTGNKFSEKVIGQKNSRKNCKVWGSASGSLKNKENGRRRNPDFVFVDSTAVPRDFRVMDDKVAESENCKSNQNQIDNRGKFSRTLLLFESRVKQKCEGKQKNAVESPQVYRTYNAESAEVKLECRPNAKKDRNCNSCRPRVSSQAGF